ncbi:MAG: arginase family protein [Nanoarchaeota archaeon]
MKIVKIKSSQGSLGKNIGCEKGPDSILKAFFEKKAFGEKNNLEIEEVKVNPNNIDETNKNILKATGDIFLGGDHSITYSLFKGFCKKKKKVGLLIFDAHPDCAFYVKSVSHEDFVRKLVDEKYLDKRNLVYVGVRKFGKSEKDFLKSIKIVKVEDVHKNIENVKNKLSNFFKKFEKFYLSIDVDVLDPKICPGTGYLEPNGLDIKELIYLISELRKLKNLGRIDLVEVNPLKDVNKITVKNAAEIVKVLI